MNARMTQFVNLLDTVKKDGQIAMEDAQAAFAKLEAEVGPHGWGWTVTVAVVAVAAGFFLGKL